MTWSNWLNWALSFVAFTVIQGENGDENDAHQQELLDRASRFESATLETLYDQ